MDPQARRESDYNDALLASATSWSFDTTNIASKSSIDSDQTASSLTRPNAKSMSDEVSMSASSIESFKSAQSIQDPTGDSIEKNNAAKLHLRVNGILNAFQRALEILDSVVERRILGNDEELWPASRALKKSLADGVSQISSYHNTHYKNNGESYINSFSENSKLPVAHLKASANFMPGNICLLSINSIFLEKVIRVLHEHLTQNGTLQKVLFDTLGQESDTCRLRTLAVFNRVVTSIQKGVASEGAQQIPIPSLNSLTADIAPKKATADVAAAIARFQEQRNWAEKCEAELARYRDGRAYQQDYVRGGPQQMALSRPAPDIACRYCRRRKVSIEHCLPSELREILTPRRSVAQASIKTPRGAAQIVHVFYKIASSSLIRHLYKLSFQPTQFTLLCAT